MMRVLWFLVFAFAWAACATTPRIVTQTVTVYVDGMDRCAPICAPYAVRFAAEDDEHRFCTCTDGMKAQGNKLQAGEER